MTAKLSTMQRTIARAVMRTFRRGEAGVAELLQIHHLADRLNIEVPDLRTCANLVADEAHQ